MKVGFTGTRKGMTPYQIFVLNRYLKAQMPEELHHGDCVGADQEAGRVAFLLGIPIMVHPPTELEHRSPISVGTLLPAKPYIKRNHDIVDAVDVLIACPDGNKERLRSGTWATVRYARQHQGKKAIMIIWPHPR